MMNPLVCVVMPAYNAAEYIKDAVLSVMAQTYKNWELLIIDDGSTDTTSEIVEKIAAEDSRISYIKNEKNMGVARTRNRGMDLCKGDYIAFLDSDDMWHPEKLKEQIKCMEENKADLSYTSYALVNREGEKIKEDYLVPKTVSFEELLKENVIGCSTVMLRGSSAQKYRFQPDFYHEDYVLWLEYLKNGHIAAGCTQVLTNWRYIPNSRSFNKWNAAKKRWHIYRRYLKLSVVKSGTLLMHYMFRALKKYR